MPIPTLGGLLGEALCDPRQTEIGFLTNGLPTGTGLLQDRQTVETDRALAAQGLSYGAGGGI